jgi:drug/metabolite transporter (DMT)-like permease
LTLKKIWAPALLGVFIYAASALQQLGMRYTSAANAGFITGLYVVLIPVFLAIFWRQAPRMIIWPASLLASAGLFLLSTGGHLGTLNKGDLFELAGALLWAVHIIFLGKFMQRYDVVPLSVAQYLICGVLSLITGLMTETALLPALPGAWWAIAYTGILSVGVGFTFQAMGQKVAPPADAALLLSLEAVFAALFGWVLLKEGLSGLQLFGCILIFSGMLLAQSTAFKSARH